MIETLLWDCFEGPNKCAADGLSASIRSMPKDTVALAFKLDGDAFRRAAGLENERCCDGLLLVLQKPPSKHPRPTLMLLEMKGRNYPHAVEQLETTLRALQACLRDRLDDISYQRSRFVAAIISDRATAGRTVAAANPQKPDIERFQVKYGAQLRVLKGQRAADGREGPSADLTSLLPRLS